MKGARKEDGGAHLLAVLQEAAKVGMTTEVLGGGDAFSLEFILREGVLRPEVLGTATIWVAGTYNGVRGMACARGIGIEMLRRAGWPEDVLGAIERLKSWPENTRKAQRAALDRCRVEMQRRADYAAAMEAGDAELAEKLAIPARAGGVPR